ncbi:hypothetical protein MD484_g9006, partial [Candolleomyces efflorescens]
MLALWRSGGLSTAFRANKCVDYVNGSSEAAAQIWVALNFKPSTDLTPTPPAVSMAELENGSIQRPHGRSVDVAAALDWEYDEYQRLKDWLEDKAKNVLDPFKTFSRQDSTSLRQVSDDAIVAFPALKRYEGNWPVVTILTAILKHRPGLIRKQGPGLIPKPMGEPSGGFVRKNLDWDQREFDIFNAWLERQAVEKLDLHARFKAQNPRDLEDIFDAVCGSDLFFRRFSSSSAQFRH